MALPRDVDSELAALRASAVEDPDVPEAVRGFLAGGAKLDALRLDARGRWTFNGVPVQHPRVAALFARSLHQTPAGTWVLRVPPYTYPVLVEGVGRFVDRVRADLTEGHTTGDRWVALDLASLETDGAEYLGVRVEGEAARLIGSAYQSVAASLDADDSGWVLVWDGTRYPIAVREPVG